MPKCTNVSCLKNYVLEMLKMVNISASTFLSNSYLAIYGSQEFQQLPEGVKKQLIN